MRSIAVAVLVGVIAVGAAAAGAQPDISLKLAYWEKGLPSAGAEPITWTLRCGPAGGTLPRPGIACSRLLAGGRDLFTPVADDAICTQIYGGPQIARVVGVVEGRRVWATFSRTNGCHIARWDKLAPWLLPRGGVRR
jgi:Subtilisin inhibitor-like